MRRFTLSIFVLATLVVAGAQNVHIVPPTAPPPPGGATAANKPLALTPAFKPAAEAALDAIDSAGSDDGAPEVVFAMQLANARHELNRAKREVRTKQDAIAAQKLLLLFNRLNPCRYLRSGSGDSYKSCLAERSERYDDAASAIGAKTWKVVNELAGP